MRKIILGLIIIIVIVAVAIYLYPRANTIPTVTSVPAQTSTAPNPSSTPPIHVPINTVNFGNNVRFPITNTTTQEVISIQDTGVAAQNPSSYIYANLKKVGEISGYSSMASFSPDNSHFAVLQTTDEGCAGDCFGFSISVVDLINGTMITLEPQPYPHDEYIESYVWDSNNAMDVTSYEIAYSGGSRTTNPDYYRVSPKDVWRYDLTTGSSTLISSTP